MKKAKLTLTDTEHAVDGYVFIKNWDIRPGYGNKKGTMFAFDQETAEQILDDLGYVSEFSTITRSYQTSQGRIQDETLDVLAYHTPASLENRVVDGIDIGDYCEKKFVFPLVFDDIEWKLLVDEKPSDVFDIAKAAADDLVSSINVVIDSYLSVLDTANERDRLLQAIQHHLDLDDVDTDISDIIKSKQGEVAQGFIYCKGCNYLVPDDEFHKEERTETRVEQTYTDAGWGDDDMFGDVTRLNTYRVCERCGDEQLVDSMYISTKNERRRGQ